jgi:tRNA dimethylallyltransferase
MAQPLLVITGPTASGKTSRAVDVAKAFDAEIISADSRQVYRGMDLGTGKDLDEYGSVPYHLIDIAPAGYRYNLYEYLRDCRKALVDIRSRGRLPLLCGGTGLYVESVCKDVRLPEVPENTLLRRQLEGKTLDELTAILASMQQLHNTTDVDNARRAVRAIEIATYCRENPEAALGMSGKPSDDALIIIVDIPRDARRRRISERLRARLDAGMVDEVRRLIDGGVAPDDLIYYGLEYKFITRHVIGELSYDEMVSGLEIAIQQFAKRQMTWFRGMERRGFRLHYLPYDLGREEFVGEVRRLAGSIGL